MFIPTNIASLSKRRTSQHSIRLTSSFRKGYKVTLPPGFDQTKRSMCSSVIPFSRITHRSVTARAAGLFQKMNIKADSFRHRYLISHRDAPKQPYTVLLLHLIIRHLWLLIDTMGNVFSSQPSAAIDKSTEGASFASDFYAKTTCRSIQRHFIF